MDARRMADDRERAKDRRVRGFRVRRVRPKRYGRRVRSVDDRIARVATNVAGRLRPTPPHSGMKSILARRNYYFSRLILIYQKQKKNLIIIL